VTCYFRHLQGIFEKAGIKVTEANKREIDRVIHEIVGIKYKDCPSTWKELRKRLAQDEESFVLELREKWSKHF
jgi:predicted Fe-Mo cluster-binding NifX family protein